MLVPRFTERFSPFICPAKGRLVASERRSSFFRNVASRIESVFGMVEKPYGRLNDSHRIVRAADRCFLCDWTLASAFRLQRLPDTCAEQIRWQCVPGRNQSLDSETHHKVQIEIGERGDEEQAIEAIQSAAVSGQGLAEVLDAQFS